MKNLLFMALLLLPGFIFAQTKEELIAQVKANPKSIESLKTIQRVGGYYPDYNELNGLFKGLDKSVRKSKEGKAFAYYLKRLEESSVGKKAPAITQLTPEGEPFSLSDLRGKYVLIDFWASWCPDCRRENPNLVKTYAQFKDKNFEILGVSFDRKMEDWVRAIETDKLTWKHISDLQAWQNAAGTLYGVRSIPQNILVDPNGIIIARNLHGEALDAKLREVL
ncbi:peroxiredoxin [Sphingobacterium allocomposti]|jgi:peroxiredoxin|uniref:Peroxiredoxin n=1 Tax=Sphingobacterium allocomposti TaxID=415956 RepID=A0A5S5D6Y1_9SPHI|nr:TlpA disulfide reductase family protein [Sphingobacterium composti Yoo et al. 2007 non Ten et al. 2007]TYP91823.1 peroxiredoxin [Sphingobacterium composti Yoo et al. 2007 non Ten et al. 2007]HLS95685.1 TlpA disulfide reductase family protein [Sphingobacterium sp.]